MAIKKLSKISLSFKFAIFFRLSRQTTTAVFLGNPSRPPEFILSKYQIWKFKRLLKKVVAKNVSFLATTSSLLVFLSSWQKPLSH